MILVHILCESLNNNLDTKFSHLFVNSLSMATHLGAPQGSLAPAPAPAASSAFSITAPAATVPISTISTWGQRSRIPRVTTTQRPAAARRRSRVLRARRSGGLRIPRARSRGHRGKLYSRAKLLEREQRSNEWEDWSLNCGSVVASDR